MSPSMKRYGQQRIHVRKHILKRGQEKFALDEKPEEELADCLFESG